MQADRNFRPILTLASANQLKGRHAVVLLVKLDERRTLWHDPMPR